MLMLLDTLEPIQHMFQDMNVSVETKYLEPGVRASAGPGSASPVGVAAQDVSLVLKPVPGSAHAHSVSPRRPSPAESTKTLVNEPWAEAEGSFKLSAEERLDKRGSPRPYPLNRHMTSAMSSLRYEYRHLFRNFPNKWLISK